MNKYRKVEGNLEAKLNRKPTVEEVALEMGISIEEATIMFRFRDDTVSLNATVGDDDTELQYFISSDAESPEELTVINSMKEDIKKVFEKCKLSEREIEILMLRYGFNEQKPMALADIGVRIGLTRERIRQIEKRALEKVRKSKHVKELAIYLPYPEKILGGVDVRSFRVHMSKRNSDSRYEHDEKDIKQPVVTADGVKDESKEALKPAIVINNDFKNETIKTTALIDNNYEGETINPIVTDVGNLKAKSIAGNNSDDDNNLDILKLSIFSQVMEELSAKELVIVSLKLGYVDEKCFSSDDIAGFLGVKKEEVLETTKAALLLYKEKVNCFFDDVIQKIVNDGSGSKILSKASDKSANNA